MDWNSIVYFLPYVFSLIVPLGVGIYSFRHRSVSGAIQYGWIVTNRLVGNLAYIFELTSPSLEGKVFWNSIELMCMSVITTLFAAFVFEYTDNKPRKPRLTWGALLVIPIVYFFLLITNGYHGWVIREPWIEADITFSPVHYELTPVTWILTIYGMSVALVLVGMLLGKFFHSQPIFRAQAFAVAAGFILGIIGVGVAAAGFQQIGIFVITSIVIHLVIAWGLFRYQLFDLKPIARDKLFEKLTDLVVVLDAQNRVVDINRTALRYFYLTPSQAIGKLAEPIFSRWPELIRKFGQPDTGSVEVAVKRRQKYRHFDVHSTLLYDRHRHYQGRILVARNITAYSALQWKQRILNKELRKLNRELEDRVRERTEDLAQAYDTTLEGWARALELRDKETEGHSRRVTAMTLQLARALDVAEADLDDLGAAPCCTILVRWPSRMKSCGKRKTILPRNARSWTNTQPSPTNYCRRSSSSKRRSRYLTATMNAGTVRDTHAVCAGTRSRFLPGFFRSWMSGTRSSPTVPTAKPGRNARRGHISGRRPFTHSIRGL